jgi:hypothetical protein
MCHHHHRINVPIAGAHTFLMDKITLGEIYVDIKLVWIVHNVAAASLRYTSNLDQVTKKCISAIKYYNVNNDWRHVTLHYTNLNRANRVYRADQYLYKLQQFIVEPRSPKEHQLGGGFSLFAEWRICHRPHNSKAKNKSMHKKTKYFWN